MKRLAFLPAVLMIAACSSSGGNTGGGSGGGTGGTGGTGGGSARGPVAFLSAMQIESAGGVNRGSSAGFYPSGPPIPSGAISCTFSNTGGCDISDCVHDGGSPSFDGGAGVSAGEVTIAVAGSDGGPPLTRSATVGAYFGSGVGAWWNGGEIVTARATGGDAGVPAFSAMLMAPTRLAVSQPANDGGPLTVTRSMPLSVAWAPGTGSVSISIQSGMLVGGRSLKAVCSVNASAGSFTVPASVTAVLLPTTAGFFQITNATITDTAAGPYSVRTTVSTTSATRLVTVP